jgi:hypothetical protein
MTDPEECVPPIPSILFFDIDDVLCLNQPKGCLQAYCSLNRPDFTPANLWENLFSVEAVNALKTLLEDCQPRVVVTSTWLSLMDKQQLQDVFRKTGLTLLADSFHSKWDAPTNRDQSRLDAIEAWLEAHHIDEAILIVDDFNSGPSIEDSFHHECGRALLCEPGRGFHAGMLPAARRALRRPYSREEPWKF